LEGEEPGRVRLGDLNIDGYPDLFMTLNIKDNDTNETSKKSQVLMNIECTEDFCVNLTSTKKRRYFNVTDSTREFEMLSNLTKNSSLITPIDIN